MKKLGIGLVAAALLFGLCACGTGAANQGETEPLMRESFMLDTIIKITLYDWEDENTLTLAMDEIHRLENLLSATRQGSDIDRLNQAAGQDWVEISPECQEVLLLAKGYWQLSEGHFDVTTGPLISLWNIRDDGGHYPSQEELALVQPLISSENLLVEDGRAFLTQEGMAVELGAIAKGYIADCVAEFLEQQGVENAIVDLGRNLVTMGSKPDGSPYRIGVHDPFGGEEDYLAILEISGESVVTAGDYERFFVHEGVRYHHILDPFTGFPADAGLSAVTIVTLCSADADALATACMLLGEEKGLALAEGLEGVEAIFARTDGTCAETTGFSDYVATAYYT